MVLNLTSFEDQVREFSSTDYKPQINTIITTSDTNKKKTLDISSLLKLKGQKVKEIIDKLPSKDVDKEEKKEPEFNLYRDRKVIIS